MYRVVLFALVFYLSLFIAFFFFMADQEENSPRCNRSGTYECGACTCNEGRYGQFCECDGTTVSDRDYDAACKASVLLSRSFPLLVLDLGALAAIRILTVIKCLQL